MATESTSCSVDGCNGAHAARGYCFIHWRRWRKHGSPYGGRPAANRKHAQLCSIPGCDKPYLARGWCKDHWQRWKRNGDPLGGGTARGIAKRYFSEVVLSYEGSDCLIWPHCRNKKGYAILGNRTLHRLVCVTVNGKPPTSKHEAAHSCGKGHLGCVNPNHLSWKTRSENQADRIIHDTHNRGERCCLAKLTEEQVREIRRATGTQLEIATRYGVGTTTIRNIRDGTTWGWLV